MSEVLTKTVAGVRVVSLDQDENRRQYVRKHFKSIGIPSDRYSFFPATTHTSPKVAEFYRAGRVQGWPPCFRCKAEECDCPNNVLIPQQVGNWISFLSLWEELRTRNGLFLICEDDVVFFDGAIGLLNEFITSFQQTRENVLIRLAESGRDPRVRLDRRRRLSCGDRVVMSNAAYLVNGAMAGHLVRRFSRIETTSDIWVHSVVAGDDTVQACTVSPLIATELSYNVHFSRFPSRIHPKGIDPADVARKDVHQMRVRDKEEYETAFLLWSGRGAAKRETRMVRQWNYLASNIFQTRYMLVASALRNFQNILEIGSYKTPLFQFINDDSKRIVCVDPMVHETQKSDVQKSVMLDFRCLNRALFQGEPFALVILGLDLPINEKLKWFMRNAELVILEFPEDEEWKKSRELYESLRDELGLRELCGLMLDFEDNDFSEYKGPDAWPPRMKRYIKMVSAKYAEPRALGDTNPFVEPLKEVDTSKSMMINTNFLKEKIFPESDFEFSHGASAATGYLGGGLLYYCIAHMLRAQVCVCLGSGGAFVPRLMRQAQRDLGMGDESTTILIDGNKGNYGRPNWLAERSFLRSEYSDIEIMVSDTVEAARVLSEKKIEIDYLHVDADHSHEGSLRDLTSYLPLLKSASIISFHDTKLGSHPNVTCGKALDDAKKMGLEVLDMPFAGSGIALMRVPRTDRVRV